jgi:polyisoprenoid-binding protein YceI
MRPTLLVVAITALIPRVAPAAEFLVRPGGENKVVFVSTATMEKFEGKTNRLEGRIVVDSTALGDSITVHLEVDLASLDTGIARRNQHMRENHLETGKFPKAVFDGATVVGPSGVALNPGTPSAFDAEGTFTLHGVSRRLRVRVEATYRPNQKNRSIAFHTTFPVVLSDYQISRPQFLFLKLAESQDVRVSGVAVASP